MKTYKASVFGSTGLIGGFLTDILINDPLCEQVVTLTRNEVIINNTKHKNHVIPHHFLLTQQIPLYLLQPYPPHPCQD